jgi:hypothetical protein
MYFMQAGMCAGEVIGISEVIGGVRAAHWEQVGMEIARRAWANTRRFGLNVRVEDGSAGLNGLPGFIECSN